MSRLRVLLPAVTRAFVTGALLFACARDTRAEPLVKLEDGQPRPGLITAWKAEDKVVELTLAAGADPGAVAATIEANVEKVKAKVQAGKIMVRGRPQDDLLKALAGVNFGDDGADALAAAALGGEDTDSGSSLRAKKTADLDALLKDQASTASGKVTGVEQQSYPEVVLSIQVLRAPSGDLGKQIRKGSTIKVRPALKKSGAAVDFTDANTQTNVGAWYLEKNDSVTVKLGAESGGMYEAVLLSR